MSDTPNNTLHADTEDTDHNGNDLRDSDDYADQVSGGHDGYEYHTTTVTDHELHGNDLRDSDDYADEVSGGHDGYEYHATTATDHELHGNDLRDSVLTGAIWDDKLVGGTRNDVLDGADGNNTLEGGSGDDVLVAGGETNHGQNHLNGGVGDDVLVAGGTKTHALDDVLKANPLLSAAFTSDAKYASLSTLAKGATDDSGGGAVNTFELQSGNGHDLILNFHASSDKLEIHRGLNGSDIQDTASLASHIHVSGNDVSFDLGDGNSVTLVGVDVGHLSEANLTWV